mmetsp:Transcript_53141/g.94838  ORF Transcript_53141/g.94838 Transcript_53141/m.94838 type:complete len:342 (-) Transcript_53141:1226-2251(-)
MGAGLENDPHPHAGSPDPQASPPLLPPSTAHGPCQVAKTGRLPKGQAGPGQAEGQKGRRPQKSDYFDEQKAKLLAGLGSEEADLSPKGHVDTLCIPVIDLINGHADAVTTSSCSGRVSIFHSGEAMGVKKKSRGGGWLLVSHDPITAQAVIEAVTPLPEGPGMVLFKFEPFILHVQCRSLSVAQAILTAAVGAGYRNSGLMAGSKMMVAVRSSLHLDVPIATEGQLLVDTQYLSLLTDLTNRKFEENAQRIANLCQALKRDWLEQAPTLPRAARRRQRLEAAGLPDSGPKHKGKSNKQKKKEKHDANPSLDTSTTSPNPHIPPIPAAFDPNDPPDRKGGVV